MPAWIEYLQTVDSPTLSNAIELLKIRPPSEGFTPLEIRCLFPEFGRMCGYAVTAQVETVTTSEPFDLAVFVELFRAVERSPKPAVVALQEIGPHPDCAAHCGEVMATRDDVIGHVVNVSARVAESAKGDEVLVTTAVRDAARAVSDVEFSRARRKSFKGVGEAIGVCRARLIES